MTSRIKTVLSLWLALLLAVPASGVAFAEQTTVAEESEGYVILAGETDIEKLAAAEAEARSALDDVNEKVAELQVRIDVIESELPAQQARSDAGMKQRYIMQSNPLAIVESLLSVESIGDFIKQAEYLERISRANLAELNRLLAMKERLDDARAEQERLREEAQNAYSEALSALEGAQEERAERQQKGIAEAEAQASRQGGEPSVGVAYDGGKQPDDYREAATEDAGALADGADWTMGSDEFIAEWAPRIDAYLAGSPLAGQGANFAAAAWKHGVDPRWSPAISNTESSKGRYCIRPFNAWGWGAADSDPYGLALEWGSWEEAIDAHVAGLASGYGYTISMNKAKRYCPNTWQSWYNKTLAQMAQI